MGQIGMQPYVPYVLPEQGQLVVLCFLQPQADNNVVLVADIGGTNCRFVLWRLDLQSGNHDKLFSKVC